MHYFSNTVTSPRLIGAKFKVKLSVVQCTTHTLVPRVKIIFFFLPSNKFWWFNSPRKTFNSSLTIASFRDYICLCWKVFTVCSSEKTERERERGQPTIRLWRSNSSSSSEAASALSVSLCVRGCVREREREQWAGDNQYIEAYCRSHRWCFPNSLFVFGWEKKMAMCSFSFFSKERRNSFDLRALSLKNVEEADWADLAWEIACARVHLHSSAHYVRLVESGQKWTEPVTHTHTHTQTHTHTHTHTRTHTHVHTRRGKHCWAVTHLVCVLSCKNYALTLSEENQVCE